MSLLRQAVTVAEQDPSQRPGRIRLRHPGYTTETSLLLDLQGADSPTGGIFRPLAVLACAIIADNRFDGYLSSGREPQAEALQDSTDILEPGDYYFHVPSNDNDDGEGRPYPIVPSFRHWTFPTSAADVQRLREVWDAGLAPGGRNDDCCILTAHSNGLDSAHVIPESESQWLLDNGISTHMSRLGGLGRTASQLVSHPENMVRMRADLHRVWDAKRLVIFPKPDGDGAWQLSIHCLDADPQLAALYHNRRLPKRINSSWACILARFAWTLFPLGEFLSVDVPRLLRCYDQRSQSWTAQWLDMEQRANLLAKPRSTSPKKRKQAGRSQTPTRGVNDSCDFFVDWMGNKRVRRSPDDTSKAYGRTFIDWNSNECLDMSFDSGVDGCYSQDTTLSDTEGSHRRGRSRRRHWQNVNATTTP